MIAQNSHKSALAKNAYHACVSTNVKDKKSMLTMHVWALM